MIYIVKLYASFIQGRYYNVHSLVQHRNIQLYYGLLIDTPYQILHIALA